MAYTIGMMNTKTNTTANGHMNFQPRQSALCLFTRALPECTGAAAISAEAIPNPSPSKVDQNVCVIIITPFVTLSNRVEYRVELRVPQSLCYNGHENNDVIVNVSGLR